MSYYRSAREMAEGLGLPLLLRGDADPRVLNRLERLSQFATGVAHAARFYYRLSDAVTQTGVRTGLGRQALWVTGPWGSLEHLPWAVGLADQAARAGYPAFLAERAPDGPLHSLTSGAGRSRTASIPASPPLPAGPIGMVSSDLERVYLLLPGWGADGPPASPEMRPWCLILSDALPESLEGPYPGAEGLLGVVLVAGFRDHGRAELEAAVKGLREAGHYLLGLVAVGPEGESSPEEELIPGAASEAIPEDEPLFTSSLPPAAPSPAVPSPAVPSPAVPSPAVPSPPAESEFEETLPPAPTPQAPEPIEVPEQATLPPEETSPAEPPIPEPPAVESGPQAVPLLSLWERQTKRAARSRVTYSALGIIALVLLTGAAIFLFFLRPSWRELVLRTGRNQEKSTTTAGSDTLRAQPGSPRGEQIETPLVPAPAAGESSGTGSPGEPPDSVSGLAGADTAPRPESMRVEPRIQPGAGTPEQDSSQAFSGASWPAQAPAAPPEMDSGSASVDTFVVHLSSFRLMTEAQSEVGSLGQKGIEARFIRIPLPGRGTWYRVISGRFGSFAQAESAALVWQAQGKIRLAHVVGGGGWGQPVPVGSPERDQ